MKIMTGLLVLLYLSWGARQIYRQEKINLPTLLKILLLGLYLIGLLWLLTLLAWVALL